jgi:hypothetical protein
MQCPESVLGLQSKSFPALTNLPKASGTHLSGPASAWLPFLLHMSVSDICPHLCRSEFKVLTTHHLHLSHFSCTWTWTPRAMLAFIIHMALECEDTKAQTPEPMTVLHLQLCFRWQGNCHCLCASIQLLEQQLTHTLITACSLSRKFLGKNNN